MIEEKCRTRDNEKNAVYWFELEITIVDSSGIMIQTCPVVP